MMFVNLSLQRWLVSFYTVYLYFYEIWKAKPPYVYILYAYGGFFLLSEERKEMNMQDYSINELIEKISADTIIIPKSVAFRKDVYEESKTLFGVVFTECVNDLRSYGSFINGKTVGKMMKEYVMDMTIPDIQCECLCSPTMASAARSETVMLINKINLLECLRESQVI